MATHNLSHIAVDAEHFVKEYIQSKDVRPHHVTTFVVGMSIAYQITIPSSPVNDPLDYWLMNDAQSVKDRIAEINEQLAISYREAYNIAQRIWLTRYDLVHRPMSPLAMDASIKALENDKDRFSPLTLEIVEAADQEGKDHFQIMLYTVLKKVNTMIRQERGKTYDE